jgi:O-antigen biosynthesis protein
MKFPFETSSRRVSAVLPTESPAGFERAAPVTVANLRPSVAGKYLYVGAEKFYVKGVTYGPFEPEADGSEYHQPEIVERDFALMAAAGLNAVRTYTVPPRWLLDIARWYGLRVMIGIPWEQHITFLDRGDAGSGIAERIRAAIRSCAGHPAVLCYSIGNEIPAAIARWHGRRPIERLLERFYLAAKAEDPGALVTYVNYPSTEYLNLPFLDLVAFNVYLEAPETLGAYLARLQNLAGDRPLLMAEVGLDSLRHGDDKQAEVLDWQIRTAFAQAAAGLFVFAWTDEWYRGGAEITDWNFGLVGRNREPKRALMAVSDAFQAVPVAPGASRPLVSVVICSYNGAKFLPQTLEAVSRLKYPRFEVIVVNDGSTDATPAIAAEYGGRLISIPNGGLSNARNVGWQNARGSIVAYLDDDACPDPDWLVFLVDSLLTTDFAGVCGPNLSPRDDPFMALCVDHSPGNPTHVLIDDRRAEHIPGCNMAYWRDRIAAVGGFDRTFRIAGDDVDFCWRLQQRGWSLGFCAGAVVWHHRRCTIRTYWKQQLNYGRAEAMLERKWPEKYNAVGHLSWLGRVYTKTPAGFSIAGRQRVYHGTWGTALFQSIYDVAPSAWTSILVMPEWFLMVGLFGIGALVSRWFVPLLWTVIPFVATLTVTGLNLALTVARIPLQPKTTSLWERVRYRAMIFVLHALQPMARLWGRLSFGLTPWRRRGNMSFVFPARRSLWRWDETWRSTEDRLADLEAALRDYGAIVARGGNFDRWDLEVRGGVLGTVRLLMTIEEHGQGRQLVRLRLWPAGWQRLLRGLLLVAIVVIAATPADLVSSLWWLGVCTALLARLIYEFGVVMGGVYRAFEKGAADTAARGAAEARRQPPLPAEAVPEAEPVEAMSEGQP